MAGSVRVVITGVTGKVARELLAGLPRADGIEVVGAVSRWAATEDTQKLPNGAEIPLSRDLAALLASVQADVVVDFTNAEYGLGVARTAIAQGVSPVIGTSGLTAEAVAELDAQCRTRGVAGLLAPNFAIGAVLMMHLAKVCAPFFDYAEIIELHHDQKADAPSGTAIATARMMAAAREKQMTVPETLKQTVPGSRGAVVDDITIHSVRLPGQNAHQEVIFGGLGQTLRIRHDAISRESYVPGVAVAVRGVRGLAPGLHVGLEHLLGIA